MYHPYIALLWNPADREREGLAARLLARLQGERSAWWLRLRGPGAAVLDLAPATGGASTYVLAAGRGVLYGKLFDRRDGVALSPDDVLTDDTFARSCASSAGTHLIESYWGAYVAVVPDRDSGNWIVIRDSSGMVPCYYTCVSGVTIVCASIRLAAPLLPRCHINWSYVSAFLAWPELQIRETGLEDVYELLAGESLRISGAHPITQFVWDPVSLSREMITDPGEASNELRRVTQLAISSWAAVYGTILHSLSGGFDSSLVLAILAHCAHRPKVTCLNRFADGPAEDERRYARAAAANCGMTLIELSRDYGVRLFDHHCLQTPRVEKPSVPYLLATLEAGFWNELTAKTGAEAVWTGQGGDHLFISFKTELGVIDCLRMYGLGGQLSTAIRDASRLTGLSFVNLIAKAAAVSVSRRAFRQATKMVPNGHFLSADRARSVDEEHILHPWYFAAASLAPGKRYHVLQIADVVNRHRPMPGLRNVEELHPLLSQPILETCLRIPVHVLLSQGKGRGLARQAFAQLLPREIMCREQKGSAATHFLDRFRRSRHFITDLLLDGLLVHEGILARHRLCEALDNDEPLRIETINPLFACAAAEAWVRTWHDNHDIPATQG